MTGPEHYREAERLLSLADSPAAHQGPEDPIYLVAAAQGHAILAQTAATAARLSGLTHPEGKTALAWLEAIA